MISSISSQLDVLKGKHKAEVELEMDIFCVKCRNKNPLGEFPLNKIEVCGRFNFDHNIKEIPFLTKVKSFPQASSGYVDQDYLISSKKPWKPCAPGMNPYPGASFDCCNNMYNQFPPQYHYPNPQCHLSTESAMWYLT